MEASQHMSFLFEGFGGQGDLARIQVALAQLFDGDQAITKFRVFRFVYCSHAAHTDLTKNEIALIEGVIVWQRSSGIGNGCPQSFCPWRLPALDTYDCLW